MKDFFPLTIIFLQIVLAVYFGKYVNGLSNFLNNFLS